MTGGATLGERAVRLLERIVRDGDDEAIPKSILAEARSLLEEHRAGRATLAAARGKALAELKRERGV